MVSGGGLTATLPRLFLSRGIIGAEFVIAVGGLTGLSAAILGSLYPIPRHIHAMSRDGLLFPWMGTIYSGTYTPCVATWITGILAAVLALLLDLSSLLEMLSIGALIAYSLVALSVLILRYQQQQIGLTKADIHEEISEISGQFLAENREIFDGNIMRIQENSLTDIMEEPVLTRSGDKVRLVQFSPTSETPVFSAVREKCDKKRNNHLDDRCNMQVSAMLLSYFQIKEKILFKFPENTFVGRKSKGK